MQIRNEARAKTEKLRSLKRRKASAGKMLLSLKPPEVDRSGGVWGSVRQYRAIRIDATPAKRIGMAAYSTPRKPMRRHAKSHPAVPSTRIAPKSCFGSFICRNERELVSAMVGM